MAKYVKDLDKTAMYIADFNDIEDRQAAQTRYYFVYWDEGETHWYCESVKGNGNTWSIDHPPWVQTNYSEYPWSHCADCMAQCWNDYLCSDCRARNYGLSTVETK